MPRASCDPSCVPSSACGSHCVATVRDSKPCAHHIPQTSRNRSEQQKGILNKKRAERKRNTKQSLVCSRDNKCNTHARSFLGKCIGPCKCAVLGVLSGSPRAHNVPSHVSRSVWSAVGFRRIQLRTKGRARRHGGPVASLGREPVLTNLRTPTRSRRLRSMHRETNARTAL